MDKHIKMHAARVLRSEDVLIMDIKNGFKLNEVEFAYKAAFQVLESNMPTDHSTIARSILSIGMSTLMRNIAADLPPKPQVDDNAQEPI